MQGKPRRSMMRWRIFSWKTIVDITLTCTKYLSNVGALYTFYREISFPSDCYPSFRGITCHATKPNGSVVWQAQQKSLRGWSALQFPPAPFIQPSVGCVWQTNLIYGDPTFQLSGFKGSTANIWCQIPQHTRALQGSRGMHGSMVQVCFDSRHWINKLSTRRYA